jgi:hypothetical protein
MKDTRWIAAGTAVALTALLFACGGGSSGSAGSSPSGSAAANLASGTLSAFGSVFVNGAEYALDGNTAVVDGDADDAASNAGALLVGMSLEVDASGGTASRLRYRSAVRGEVDAIDTNSSTMTVMGQTVVVTSGTTFAGHRTSGGVTSAVTQLANVSVGDYVIVYGMLDCTNSTSTSACTGGTTQVLASLVDEPGAAGAYRVEGFAESVNATTGSFLINGLTVTTTTSGSNATLCTPSPCAIANGAFVEVRSASAPVAGSASLALAATRIKAASFAPVLVGGETASIEGAVSALDTAGDRFSLRGVTIDGSALASTVATLSDGQIVDVTGTVTASGSLLATAITVTHHATFTLIAPLGAQSASAGTLTVLGQGFTVNSATRFVDFAQGVRPFNYSDFTSVLSLGDQLVVSGYAGASGNVATRVERLPAPVIAYVAVEGVVSADSSSAETMTIGGVSVDLATATIVHVPGSAGSASLSAFLGAITTGSSVATAIGTAGSPAGSMNATAAALLDANCRWAAAVF